MNGRKEMKAVITADIVDYTKYSIEEADEMLKT
jgi:hypothetical protein